MERLITAYQDGLLTLEQLRERMPNLKQQSQAVNSELQLLEMAKLDQAKYLKLAESLGGFRKKLRARAQTLDVKERQQILRLLVKEILVGFDTLTIRHSIPIPSGDGSPPNIPGSTPGSAPSPQSDYPLRPRRIHTCDDVSELPLPLILGSFIPNVRAELICRLVPASGCHSTGQPLAGSAAAQQAEFEAVRVWQLRIDRVHRRRPVASSRASSLTLVAVAPWRNAAEERRGFGKACWGKNAVSAGDTHRPGTIARNTW